MINPNQYINPYSFRSLATYDCVKSGLSDLPTNNSILWCPNDQIKPLFERLNSNIDIYGGKYIIIGTSDFGLHLQTEYPINRDILKAISRIDFEKDFFSVRDKYLRLDIQPQCVIDSCIFDHKYSLRCYHFTHATFDKIPPQVAAWYSSSLAVNEPNCECIPLGVLSDENNVASYKFSPHSKKRLCYVNFSDITVERLELKRLFSRKQYREWLTFEDKVPIEQFNRNIEEHLFILCPEGNARDSFRLWSCLYSGSIGVMELNSWSEQFNDMPVLYVKSLFDITKELLESAAKELMDAKFNLERATYGYWSSRILDRWELINV